MFLKHRYCYSSLEKWKSLEKKLLIKLFFIKIKVEQKRNMSKYNKIKDFYVKNCDEKFLQTTEISSNI